MAMMKGENKSIMQRYTPQCRYKLWCVFLLSKDKNGYTIETIQKQCVWEVLFRGEYCRNIKPNFNRGAT